MGPRKKDADIGDQLRKAIRDSGRSAYSLAKESGVSSQQIGRFLTDERDLGIRAAAKLAKALGLRLAPVADPQ